MVGRLAVRLEDPAAGTGAFDWRAAASHCRVAYLRGVLLARGSLSVAATGSHLEVVVPLDELDAHAELAAAVGYPAGRRVRRGRGVLTWKNSDSIVSLLRLLGASASTLELESRSVGRAVHGHLNRVVNAENANLRRAVAAAHRQMLDIETLDARGELRRLPRQVRRVADGRRRAPEATLAELAATLDLSRGQVQRAFQAIESAALHGEREQTLTDSE
jgi:DNA-binding protein WhiA